MPLCVLGIFSIFSGYVLKDAFIGLGSDVFTDSLPLSRERFEQDSEYLSVCAKQLPFIIILIVGSVT